jgi:hypothetical protein
MPTLQLAMWWGSCISLFCLVFLECFSFPSLDPNWYIRFKRMYWSLYGKSAVTSKIQIWVKSTIQNIALRGKIWKRNRRFSEVKWLGYRRVEAHLLGLLYSYSAVRKYTVRTRLQLSGLLDTYHTQNWKQIWNQGVWWFEWDWSPIGSNIWMIGFQLVELFGKD